MFQGLPTRYVVILPYNFIIPDRLLRLLCIFWWSMQEGAIAWGESKFVAYLWDILSDRQGRRTLEWIFGTMLWLCEPGCDFSSDGLVKRMQLYLFLVRIILYFRSFRHTFMRQLFMNVRHVSESVFWKSKITVHSVSNSGCCFKATGLTGHRYSRTCLDPTVRRRNKPCAQRWVY